MRKPPAAEPEWVCAGCGASNKGRWRACGRCVARRPTSIRLR